jgi:hypothetical protein
LLEDVEESHEHPFYETYSSEADLRPSDRDNDVMEQCITISPYAKQMSSFEMTRRRSEPACLGKISCYEPVDTSCCSSDASTEETADMHSIDSLHSVETDRDSNEKPYADNSVREFTLLEDAEESYEHPFYATYSSEADLFPSATFSPYAKPVPSFEMISLQAYSAMPREPPAHDETLTQSILDIEVLDDMKDGKQKGKPRPCKGKRIRCRKFIARLRKQMESDPKRFNIDDIEWPSMLLDHDIFGIRCKLLANLSASRDKLLSEL